MEGPLPRLQRTELTGCPMRVHYFGIRHHGPGSARNLRAALDALQPDLVLIEGPPEANPLIPFLNDPELTPPVAILAYLADRPSEAVFYPFAEFSPEWQALGYALQHEIPVEFFDLPAGYWLGKPDFDQLPPENRVRDPFDALAEISQKPDGEHWWDEVIETQKTASAALFEGVHAAVTELRAAFPGQASPRDPVREAWMREQIRLHEKAGHERIAVVCGAWHVPALQAGPGQKEDRLLLKGRTPSKVEVTWTPWTFARLTYASGYGAGIHAPGWYEHLWRYPEDGGERWLSEAAAALRRFGRDTSTAHVVESVRLAQALAALRNLHRPGLQEFNDAIVAVMGMGDDQWLTRIHTELMAPEVMGHTPEGVPRPPLVRDVEASQKRLRLAPAAGEKELTLDLRKENDLEKSHLLHRLLLLGIPWGTLQAASGKGTFKEVWRIAWRPEFHIRLIEQGVWGNTLHDACTAYLGHQTETAQDLNELVVLLENSLLAELPGLMPKLIQKLDELAAASPDLSALMRSATGLTQAIRYGSVRNLEFEELNTLRDAMLVRIQAGLPFAVGGIADDLAATLFPLIRAVDESIALIADEEKTTAWLDTLVVAGGHAACHPYLAGLAYQLVYRRNRLAPDALSGALSYHFSPGTDPGQAARWLEGFLSDSGALLLLDETLWQATDTWIAEMEEDTFVACLPVLRRAFAGFSRAERRKIGEKARTGGTQKNTAPGWLADEDTESGLAAAQTIFLLLGLTVSNP